jgi:hypothetical protein
MQLTAQAGDFLAHMQFFAFEFAQAMVIAGRVFHFLTNAGLQVFVFALKHLKMGSGH